MFQASYEEMPGTKILNEATSGFAIVGNASYIPFFENSFVSDSKFDYQDETSISFLKDKRLKPTSEIFYTESLMFSFQSADKTEAHGVHMTVAFKDDKYVFVVPLGAKYTNFEKILFPYDQMTWTFLFSIFGIAFIITFTVNQLPKIFPRMLYGEYVRNPIHNIFGTFFGITQHRLPENNFGRIILMTFIIFCLIIRTAYQGVMFEMMSKEMRKPIPKTINDLVRLNYVINPRSQESLDLLSLKLGKSL
jgi:hypothetical protein